MSGVGYDTGASGSHRGIDPRAQVLQGDGGCWELQQRYELGCHCSALVFHLGDMTCHMLSGLQTRQQWVEGWGCQAALDFLVQCQQVLIGFHLLLQEMV